MRAQGCASVSVFVPVRVPVGPGHGHSGKTSTGTHTLTLSHSHTLTLSHSRTRTLTLSHTSVAAKWGVIPALGAEQGANRRVRIGVNRRFRNPWFALRAAGFRRAPVKNKGNDKRRSDPTMWVGGRCEQRRRAIQSRQVFMTGPSIRSICSRCCFAMTGMMQACSNFL